MPHTPGPWRPCFHLQSAENDASCTCGYRGGIGGPDGEHVVCEIGGPDEAEGVGPVPARYDRATELANAALIAAAPELLAVLEKVVAHTEGGGVLKIANIGQEDTAVYRLVKAAIAKAKGAAVSTKEGESHF